MCIIFILLISRKNIIVKRLPCIKNHYINNGSDLDTEFNADNMYINNESTNIKN